jgi:hypothetical protein
MDFHAVSLLVDAEEGMPERQTEPLERAAFRRNAIGFMELVIISHYDPSPEGRQAP